MAVHSQISLSKAPDNENSAIKIELVSFSNGIAVIKETNKQNCKALMSIDYGTPKKTRSKYITAHNSDTFHIKASFGDKVVGKTNTECDCYDPDDVKLIINSSLPITFKYLIWKRLGDKEFYIEFEAEDTDGEDRFEIELSNDFVHFFTKTIVFPDPIRTNIIYKSKITL